MSYAVKLARSADACIAAQVDWYDSEEPGGSGDGELAHRWFNLLHIALTKLSHNPQHHGFAPENGKWMPQHQIRQMLFRPWKSGVGWRVLYTIGEEAMTVTVLQIRHEHRRYLHDSEDENVG